jgi:glyoxylase-like metal-dependent hydrolase (beta-lactamase superfamily II)
MLKPMAKSLNEIGVAPENIAHFAMSHSHGDHSGNANLFFRSTIYMQTAEYDAIYGPEPQKLGIPPTNFENLREARIVKLNGDHNVFGDGSVVIKSSPGHSPGHQSLCTAAKNWAGVAVRRFCSSENQLGGQARALY